MLFRFVPPALSKLDDLDTEILVASVHTDVRPARGVAGLCDFRMGGRISRLLRDGFVTGEVGEVVMMPGKPMLAFDKLLLFGAGPADAFDARLFSKLVQSIFSRLAKLRTRVAAVELPGRAQGVISPNDAARALLDQAELAPEWDSWILVEPVEARGVFESAIAERRRRLRREI
ncbi:MAG: M17 family peptidase N-terminal domain-containing protein [Polyangiaceae bacterium]